MKNRLREKCSICRCTHDKSFDDMVTNDPYPMYIRTTEKVNLKSVFLILEYGFILLFF